MGSPMPHLADPNEQLEHLRKAIAGKDRWDLVTHLDVGHLLQLALGTGLIVSGVADANLGYESCAAWTGTRRPSTAAWATASAAGGSEGTAGGVVSTRRPPRINTTTLTEDQQGAE